MQQGSVLVHVADMDASSLTVLSISKRVKGVISVFTHRFGDLLDGVYRHMNMDYSFTQALRRCEECQRVCHFYDINCNFWIHFLERCADNEFLHVPEAMEFFRGIGLFHVHGHQNECFPRFAPSFILGAGQIEGEIIETLWVPLNEISPSTRNMSKAYRQELLDMHMNDSNWKKLVRMGSAIPSPSTSHIFTSIAVPSLVKKWKKVGRGIKDSQEGYTAICESISEENKVLWEEMDLDAQVHRWADPTAMDIYDVQADKSG